jgi:hypothetical protein
VEGRSKLEHRSSLAFWVEVRGDENGREGVEEENLSLVSHSTILLILLWAKNQG